jgi:hypothetical protein
LFVVRNNEHEDEYEWEHEYEKEARVRVGGTRRRYEYEWEYEVRVRAGVRVGAKNPHANHWAAEPPPVTTAWVVFLARATVAGAIDNGSAVLTSRRPVRHNLGS